ncbi:putative GTP-binding protein 6 [Tetranychus urticae]|uniref:Hflx-type G domain-containing protein n=1 Tax=Tetranychus urticae TaxID=32264 RepID=T1KLM4_TETUR|nr:putative GTP-binding protein 6 [Tetranychus urticae]
MMNFLKRLTFSSKFYKHSTVIRSLCNLNNFGENDYNFHELLTPDPEYDALRRNYIVDGRKAHSVLVCQPYIRFPTDIDDKPKSTPQLQLKESISLIHSIPKWRVSDAGLFGVNDFHKPLFFSEKTVEEIDGRIKGSSTTGLFIAADRLLGKQQYELENVLKVPVFDRYSIILEIFKNHATSAEAQIQLGLAEILYLKSRVNQYAPEVRGDKYSTGKTAGGSGMTARQRYRKLLESRTKVLKKASEKLEANKERLRLRRKELQYPIVSVIGYTNSGKTSLIKALSQDGKLSPEDRLFATLEVTAHPVKLPSLRKVLFLDSVGFIANIPKELIDSFNVTFKEVANSDLLLHIYDASHPDLANQKFTVLKTLDYLKFNPNLVSSMINVANKIDLIDDSSSENSTAIEEGDIPVSVTEGQNLKSLIEKIDTKLTQVTGQQIVKVKVPNGGEELSWLHRETTIQSIEPDADANFLIVRATMNDVQRKRFVAYFRRGKK